MSDARFSLAAIVSLFQSMLFRQETRIDRPSKDQWRHSEKVKEEINYLGQCIAYAVAADTLTE